MGCVMAQINRNGVVSFGDARLTVMEEGLGEARKSGGFQGEKEWGLQFKKDVFLRIVQQLNRLGWTCVVPQEKIDQYGFKFARSYRNCSKGDLKADLEITGRCITFQMYQNVNAPNRPDHGGKYEFYKERIMPYLLRLEMERTRRRIKNYLCAVFSGYSFSDTGEKRYGLVPSKTALEKIADHYTESSHFKGDWHDWLDKNKHFGSSGYCLSADKNQLEHGQRVYFYDTKGRINTGIAYYNINNMWWVVTGTYAYTNKACFDLFTKIPYLKKDNEKLRRNRLEAELSKAVKDMNYERAIVLRDLLFPKNEPVYVVWHTRHEAYHRANFSGYTTDINDAGKFLEREIGSYRDSTNEVRLFGSRAA